MIEECFTQFLKFSQIKERELISWEEQILQNSRIICSPLCISILKIAATHILWRSSDFNAFYMTEQCFSQFFKISSNYRGGANFFGGTNSAEELNYFVALLYSNFRNWRDQIVRHSVGFNAFYMI